MSGEERVALLWGICQSGQLVGCVLAGTASLYTTNKGIRCGNEFQSIEVEISHLEGFTYSQRSYVDNKFLGNLLNGSLNS